MVDDVHFFPGLAELPPGMFISFGAGGSAPVEGGFADNFTVGPSSSAMHVQGVEGPRNASGRVPSQGGEIGISSRP